MLLEIEWGSAVCLPCAFTPVLSLGLYILDKSKSSLKIWPGSSQFLEKQVSKEGNA